MSGRPVHPVHAAQPPAPPAREDPAGDVVRWAAFSCLLVPVVLVVYGTSYGGAAVATLGLSAVTAACRVMLRHAEKTQRAAVQVHRGRHSRTGTGTHRGCHAAGGGSPHD
ncbi:hypothetical protein DEJ50_11640 [Streptomyces venezuelae]|uniref:Uncharacterized protein n=1 Tax=Streptomyces venezuelae TaxID=54571 RepID=A0A5P2D1D4_STRVZ|nr:hypothetical protein [Streptomyces venezuelae]QES48380.1 hypothetical protein DEJ50_11640 [Streptomyces venezuelae]